MTSGCLYLNYVDMLLLLSGLLLVNHLRHGVH